VPELPEVETIVRDLAASIPGRRIVETEVYHGDLVLGEDAVSFADGLAGARIAAIHRRAKNIVFDLDDQRLVVNLGMTGRLLLEGPGAPPSTHPGVRFALDNGRTLLYHDVRRFGCLQRFAPDAWAARDRSLGLEPLSDGFTAGWLHTACSASRVAIKSWLMDQRRLVGVGNIYASEALFRAGIDPTRPARSLTRAEAERLHESIRAALLEAIEFRGTTLLDYRDASGERGGFADRLLVYDRAGQPCRSCEQPIRRIVQGGRSTFFCESCQT
jgi:formamidopyrimidine-DNA glycosylase